MPMQLEKKLVEDWAIEKLKEKGWNYVESEKLKRVSLDEPLLLEDLKKKISEINKDTKLVEEDLNAVINKLKYAPTDQNGHKEILKYLKYGVPIKTEKERIVKNIQLFDYRDFENNDFVVTNQFKFVGRENIRLDILLIINGIPLVNIECKNPYTDKKNYFDAYTQIKRYEKTAPELYKFVQIGVGFAEIVKYFPIVPWLEDVKQETWKWEGYKEDEAIFEMLKPQVLLDILKNFIFVREFRGEMTKVIGRYMQYRATNKIYQRVIDNLAGKTDLPAPRRNLSTPTGNADKYFVYAILCNDGSIYIGQTNDLSKRWQEHCEGKVSWTATHKPVEIIHYEIFETRDEAVKREKWLKTGFGRKWIKRRLKAGRLQKWDENAARQAGKNKGLIWHWQGSGKTLTMIFSAHKLYFELGKPTIFFIVDRRDLERQFNDELSSLDLNFSFEKIESISDLREVLIYDDYQGKRGVFLTLIHKFNLDEEFLLSELEEKGEIKKRKDIICFLDEVHRTQYGKLALKMKNVLKNAFFFGFTGTPISYIDRNTYKEFGYIDEKEFYLDKYFIDEAEKDGFIVPIVYELKKEKIKLKDEDLEWYLEQIDIEDIADEVELSQLKKEAKKRINEIKVILENPKEIEKVCQDLTEHFKENFNGKFKGLVVTGSRKACVRYKKILDKYLPSKYSEVVMTFNQDDEEEIQEYKRKLIERYKFNDISEIITQIIEKFRKEEYPKLLIVTDMLITGFDEPKLGVLYLHKLLKNHRLLQTIARVNRPYLEKIAGLIVDYVGIFKFIEKAFGVYLDEDVRVINRKIKNKKDAFEEFLKILKELKSLFGNLVGVFERENFDKAFEILKREENRNQFVNLYRNLRNWYEFLSTDERMVEYLKDYKWFSAVYQYYIKLMQPAVDEIKLEKYFQKTIKVIHDLTEVSEFKKKIGPAILDLNYIKSLKESNLTEEEKTIGSVYALRYFCTLNQKNPIYKSIAERVKELIKKWEKSEIDITTLSSEIEDILNYINEKEREKKITSLNEIEFGIKLLLENNKKIKKEEIEKIAREIFEKIKGSLFMEWNKNPAISKEVSKRIREYLTEIRTNYNLSYEEFDKLHQEVFDFIVNL